MPDKGCFYSVDFEYLEEGNLLISFSEKNKESAFESWRIPGHVVDELILWWKMEKNNTRKDLHERGRTESCEFSINSEKYIEVEELFKFSSPKTNFWVLTIDTMESLVCWSKSVG